MYCKSPVRTQSRPRAVGASCVLPFSVLATFYSFSHGEMSRHSCRTHRAPALCERGPQRRDAHDAATHALSLKPLNALFTCVDVSCVCASRSPWNISNVQYHEIKHHPAAIKCITIYSYTRFIIAVLTTTLYYRDELRNYLCGYGVLRGLRLGVRDVRERDVCVRGTAYTREQDCVRRCVPPSRVCVPPLALCSHVSDTRARHLATPHARYTHGCQPDANPARAPRLPDPTRPPCRRASGTHARAA